jgi:hypothetical protein
MLPDGPGGQSALVHAAAGGVGALLIQLLLRRGARVFRTASTAATAGGRTGSHTPALRPDLPQLLRAGETGRGSYSTRWVVPPRLTAWRL